MDRINHASAEADKFGAGKDGFTDGDPVDPSSGTVVNEDFLDGVQEELIGLIEAAGETPTNADYTQLASVLLARVAAGGYQASEGIQFSGLADAQSRLYDYTDSGVDDKICWATFGTIGEQVKMYYSRESIEFARNCVWNGTGWNSNGSDECVVIVDLRADGTGPGLTIERELVANAFTETTLFRGQPAAPTTAQANLVYPAALPKAIGHVQVLSGGTPAVGTGNVNISNTVGKEVGGALSINFDTPFADTNYIVQVTNRNPTSGWVQHSVVNVSVSEFWVTTHNSGGLVDPTSDTIQFNITVHGAQ